MFLYAYRAFIAALATHNKSVLKKMTEPRLYNALCQNHAELKKLNCKYFCVEENIKMKLMLIDIQKIHGLYIDRTQNLSEDCYDIDTDESNSDKVVFKRIVNNKDKTLS